MCPGGLNQEAVSMFEEATDKATIMLHRTIGVDGAGITSVSTAAIRSILTYLGTIDSLGLNLVLYNLQPAVQERLDQTDLTSVLMILPGIKEAYLLHKH